MQDFRRVGAMQLLAGHWRAVEHVHHDMGVDIDMGATRDSIGRKRAIGQMVLTVNPNIKRTKHACCACVFKCMYSFWYI